MTKVAIKGPATGTGSYTLNAPDTDSTLELELPITGTRLASAQADGMPLGLDGDPVVESGSNSDGEWVRWADGTQECYTELQIQPGEGTSAGGLYTSPLSTPLFPLSFLESPSGSVGYSDSSDLGFWLQGRGINTTQWGVKFFRLNSFTGTGDETVELKATGRWK